jgi:hypothetical protein
MKTNNKDFVVIETVGGGKSFDGDICGGLVQ